MKLRDQLSLSEIAKRTGLSRNKVKKWLKALSDVVPRYERASFEGKLTAFEPTLHQVLVADAHRPKQGRRSGRALFAQIQAQGYRGGYPQSLKGAHAARRLPAQGILYDRERGHYRDK